MVELIKERLAVTEDRREIIQLSTIVPCDLSMSKVAEIFYVSEYTARQARQLRVQEGIVSIPEWIQRVGISRETKQKLFLHFMRVKKSVVYSQWRKIVLVFNFQIKQRQRNRNSIFHLTFQRFMYSLKRKILTGNWLFIVCTLTSKVVHPCCCSRYTQDLCLHLSPKCRTHAGSNGFISHLQTIKGDMCMWYWQLRLYLKIMIGHCDDCPYPSVLVSFLQNGLLETINPY